MSNNLTAFRLLELAGRDNKDNNSNTLLGYGALLLASELLARGADGAALEELQALFNFGHAQVIRDLMETGNAVFSDNGNPANPVFAAGVQRELDALVQNLDFRGDASGTADAINAWVKGKTNGRIDQLVSPALIAALDTLLVSTTRFSGDWAKPFDPESTMEGDFHAPNGVVEADFMMDDEMYAPFCQLADGTKGLLLPLKSESDNSWMFGGTPKEPKNLGVLFILPDEQEGIDALLQRLGNDPQAYGELIAALNPTDDIIVRIPKFDIKTQSDLEDLLQQLGLSKIFGPGHLNRIATNLLVRKVVHAAGFRINEKGAEGEAAVGYGGFSMCASVGGPVPQTFIADRPFLAAVVHLQDPTNIGFIAKVVNPTA